jgi:hypothetical protein
MDGSLSVPVEYIRMVGEPLTDLQISRQVRVIQDLIWPLSMGTHH